MIHLLTLLVLQSTSPISLEQIMADPSWMGDLPVAIKAGLHERDLMVQLQAEAGAPDDWRVLSFDGELEALSGQARIGVQTRVMLQREDRRVRQTQSGIWYQRGEDVRPIHFGLEGAVLVKWLDKGVVFRHEQELWLWDEQVGSSVLLTKVGFLDEEKDDDGWAHTEEPQLIEYVAFLAKQKEQRERASDIERDYGAFRLPKPVRLGAGQKLATIGIQEDDQYAFSVSDDLRYAYAIVQGEKDGEPTTYAQFINAAGNVTALDARPRVGHASQTWRLAIIDRVDDSMRWVDFSDLPEIKVDRRGRLNDENAPLLEQPRPVFMASSDFASASHRILMTLVSMDFKDRWIVEVHAETAAVKLVHHHYDPAWLQYYLRNVDLSPQVSGRAFWINQGHDVAFLSDEGGFQQIYVMRNSKARPLMEGQFEVYSPFQRGGQWYFHANLQNPGIRHFYRLDGNRPVQLTQGNGFHDAFFVGDVLVDMASESNRPPYVKIREGQQGWRELYDGRSKAFKSYPWRVPEFVTFPNDDGSEVHARLYRPNTSNGAGVVFIHGAGYLQNAHRAWSVYFREYMFHNLLADQGFTVLDPDYRASAGYGRDWRTAIYRHMGDKDLQDVKAAARYLASLDLEKQGVYGGSYGGFLTLMAMFKEPDLFAAGAALRPVTDWAYYNDWYTSRILNTPQTDPEAYRRSSPIYFVEGLKGELIICHGMVDDNVHYQDSVRLAQRLIELKKSGWSLHGYPVEPHGFRMPSSWYDEYRRIFELFDANLK